MRPTSLGRGVRRIIRRRGRESQLLQPILLLLANSHRCPSPFRPPNPLVLLLDHRYRFILLLPLLTPSSRRSRGPTCPAHSPPSPTTSLLLLLLTPASSPLLPLHQTLLRTPTAPNPTLSLLPSWNPRRSRLEQVAQDQDQESSLVLSRSQLRRRRRSSSLSTLPSLLTSNPFRRSPHHLLNISNRRSAARRVERRGKRRGWLLLRPLLRWDLLLERGGRKRKAQKDWGWSRWRRRLGRRS